jgi:hypothetical protein
VTVTVTVAKPIGPILAVVAVPFNCWGISTVLTVVVVVATVSILPAVPELGVGVGVGGSFQLSSWELLPVVGIETDSPPWLLSVWCLWSLMGGIQRVPLLKLPGNAL